MAYKNYRGRFFCRLFYGEESPACALYGLRMGRESDLKTAAGIGSAYDPQSLRDQGIPLPAQKGPADTSSDAMGRGEVC